MNKVEYDKCKVAIAYILKRLRDEGLSLEQARELYPFLKRMTDEFDKQSRLGAIRHDEEERKQRQEEERLRSKERMDRRRSGRNSSEG